MSYTRRESRTLSDVAEQRLREAIISGELQPGQPLRLREQIERLEMSSVPIREALRYLEGSGLVERKPHRGTLVAEMSADDLTDTYEIRMALESIAVRRAVERMTTEDHTRIKELLEEYADEWEVDSELARQLHRELHTTIYAAAGSRWLARMVPMLWDNSERYRRLSLAYRSPEEVVAEHREIVDCCVARDPDRAVAALQDHLRHTFEMAIQALREREGHSAG